MPSFSDLIGSMKAAAKAPVQQAGYSTRGTMQQGSARVQANVQAAVGRASQAALGNVLGAATQAINGDTAGAFRTLGNMPSAVLDKAFPQKKKPGMQLLSSAPAENNPLYGINSRKDAVLNFNWFATLPEVNRLALPWYYCEAANLSYRNIETQQIYRRAHNETLPKSYSVPPVRLSFMLDDSMVTMNYLAGWQDIILGWFDGHARTQGKWGRPADFKKPITVNVLSVNKTVVMKVKYLGAWPSGFDSMNLVSDNQGRLIAEIDFSVDDVTYEFSPAQEVLNPLSLSAKPMSATGSVSSVLGAVANRVSGLFNSDGLSTSSSVLARGASTILGV